ncbi:hypothetical protein AB4Y78_04815 [Janibacter sp. RAF52]|uniref:hypothetical protein n=1 Tax=unclassified Janibacter TaxID=2649294 RepID=UPI003F8E7BDC
MTTTRPMDVSSDIEAVADSRRLQAIDSAHAVGRPDAYDVTYAELEYDELAAEQLELWKAEADAASRSPEAGHSQTLVASTEVRRLVKRQRAVMAQSRQALLNTRQNLQPFRRREPGAKKWYLIRWAALLGGDIAGQAGAALMYGEHPITAIPQAVATGMAALTAGLVGGELRTLRDSARRHQAVPEHLELWAHLFTHPDPGRRLALCALGIGAIATLTIAGGIFWLRAITDGAAAGATYGLLALGIAFASVINCYFYADEIADAIDGAEADYKRELTRSHDLSNKPEVQGHASSGAQAISIREEHLARGRAAAARMRALKWRILGNNPGVAGHGSSRSSRGGDRS